MQLFLRTRPQLWHGRLQGALRNEGPLWHGAHQMWQMKHPKKFFGNKSKKSLLKRSLLYTHTWKIAVMIAIAAFGFWALYPCLIPSEGAPRVETQTPWEQKGPGTEMTQLQWSLRRALAWSIPNLIRKVQRTLQSIWKTLNQDGKSKGTLHHVLCLPAQHIAIITSENFCVSLSLGQASLSL